MIPMIVTIVLLRFNSKFLFVNFFSKSILLTYYFSVFQLDNTICCFSYFCSLYSDYKKEQANYQGLPNIKGTDTFSRTNHVIGVGIDYKF